MLKSILKNRPLSQSPVAGSSALVKRSEKTRRTIIASLMLTSLVDAFSILVIYLLMNTSASAEVVEVKKGIQLPQATATEMLEPATVIRIENGRYFIDKREIAVDQLPIELAALKNKASAQPKGQAAGKGAMAKTGEKPSEESNKLIIQADRRTDFSALNPILLSASQSGFNQFRFAVLQVAK